METIKGVRDEEKKSLVLRITVAGIYKHVIPPPALPSYHNTRKAR